MWFNSTTKPFKTLLKQPDFRWVHTLLSDIPDADIFLVGGIVRDILLKRKSHDIDFVVRNVDAETLKQWLTHHGIVNLVGKSFGVFKFTPTDHTDIYHAFDIALPRTEHALGTGGYKDVQTQSDPHLTIEEDCARRDFTINALAYDIKKNVIIDSWNGLQDLKQKTIRCVGNPDERFQEDYSRMLRALRFACQLHFSIEDGTKNAIRQMIGHVNETLNNERVVPHETIAKEFLKSLIADPVCTLDLWDDITAWEHIMPELLLMKNCPQHEEFHAEGDVWVHTRLALQKLYSSECTTFISNHFPAFARERAHPHSSDVVLAVLLHDISKPETTQTPEKHGTDRIRAHEHESVGAKKTRAICERLKLSSPPEVGVDVDHVEWLVRNHLVAAMSENMKPTTIEKYFFKNPLHGANLLTVIWADGAATLNPKGEAALAVLHQLIGRIKDMLSHFAKKTAIMKLPKPLINGDEIMNEFNLEPNKKIGELLHIAREAQLSGDINTKQEAVKLLKTHL